MKTKTTLGLVSILSLIAVFSLCAGCSKQSQNPDLGKSTLKRVIGSKVIRAAYIVYPPTVIVKDDAKHPTGFLIDIMNEIANRAKIEVAYQATTFDDLKLAVNSDNIDIVVGGVFVNVPRAREMTFTTPIMYWAGVGAIAKRDALGHFTTLDSVNDKSVRVSVTAGTAEHDFVKQHLTNSQVKPIPSGDLSLTLLEVSAGRADVAFADVVTIKKFLVGKPELAALFDGRPFNTFAAAFVIKNEDQAWLNFLNSSIQSLHDDGTIEQLSRKYEGQNTWLLPRKPWEQ